MTPTEQQNILAALEALDQFAASAPLPRGWHVQWQAQYQGVLKRIQACLVAAPLSDFDDSEPNPGSNGAPGGDSGAGT